MIATSWKESYGLGLPELDRQHQHLLEIIDRLEDAMQQASPKMVVHSVVSDLVSYSQLHFRSEEDDMRCHGYPMRLEHGRKHASLMQQLTTFEEDLIAGRAALTPVEVDFLRSWVGDHILEADTGYANYVRQLTSNVTEMPICR